MKRQAWCTIVLMAGLLVPALAHAQAAKPDATAAKSADVAPEFQFYKLTFALRELEDGKLLNTRTYVTSMRSTVIGQPSSRASVRAGTRVPIATVARQTEGAPAETSFQYVDIGVNIDCILEVAGGGVPATAVAVVAEISTLPPSDATQARNPEAPLIRQIRGSATVPLVLDKPMLVTSVDDVASKRQYQLEVTITKK